MYMNPPLCSRDFGPYAQSTEPNSGSDFAQTRELGFDLIPTLVRLGISWSALEPTPGAIQTEYLERIAQVSAL